MTKLIGLEIAQLDESKLSMELRKLKISNDGLEQIRIIKNALDSMYDKLNGTVYT